MKIKILKDDKTIKIFADGKELKCIDKFSIERNQDDIRFMNLTIKLLVGDIEFEEKKN